MTTINGMMMCYYFSTILLYEYGVFRTHVASCGQRSNITNNDRSKRPVFSCKLIPLWSNLICNKGNRENEICACVWSQTLSIYTFINNDFKHKLFLFIPKFKHFNLISFEKHLIIRSSNKRGLRICRKATTLKKNSFYR